MSMTTNVCEVEDCFLWFQADEHCMACDKWYCHDHIVDHDCEEDDE